MIDGGSKATKQTSFVSTDNAETTPGCVGALEPTNTDGPLKNHGNSKTVVRASIPISKSSDGLGATAMMVTTKPSTTLEDKGSP